MIKKSFTADASEKLGQTPTGALERERQNVVHVKIFTEDAAEKIGKREQLINTRKC